MVGGAPGAPKILPFAMGTRNKTFLDRPQKKGRTEAQAMPETSLAIEKFPKFLVLHSEEEEKPLAKLSSFLVAKVPHQL